MGCYSLSLYFVHDSSFSEGKAENSEKKIMYKNEKSGHQEVCDLFEDTGDLYVLMVTKGLFYCSNTGGEMVTGENGCGHWIGKREIPILTKMYLGK